jgi:hypothetical protein
VPPLIHVDPELFPAEPMRCLRCGGDAPMRFAGPCPPCTAELRAKFEREARVLDSEYVPKTNVTANAVALKDD